MVANLVCDFYGVKGVKINQIYSNREQIQPCSNKDSTGFPPHCHWVYSMVFL